LFAKKHSFAPHGLPRDPHIKLQKIDLISSTYKTGHHVAPFVDPYQPYTDGLYSKGRREVKPAKRWDKFYANNADKAYKDRHWLLHEFEGWHGGLLLDCGCGVGNATLPLLTKLPDLTVAAFDFSVTAIDVFKRDLDFDSKRIDAFVHDISEEELPPSLHSKADFALLLFVMSAIEPEKHLTVLRHVAEALKEGGLLFFRDYGHGDLAQQRFIKRRSATNDCDEFFARGDGTRSYFFAVDEFKELVLQTRLEIVKVEIVERKKVNRKQNVEMERRFLQAILMRKRD
jgi:SAM-dependent methyltransferase